MPTTLKYRINGTSFRLRFDTRPEAEIRAAVLIASGIPVVIKPAR